MAEPHSLSWHYLQVRWFAGGECRLARGTGRTNHRANSAPTRWGTTATSSPALAGLRALFILPVKTLPASRRTARRTRNRQTFQIVQPFVGLSVRHSGRGHLIIANARRRSLPLIRSAATWGLARLDRPATRPAAGRKRLELARALATEPKVLLLDEVLAGLNPSEIRDIVPVIRDFCRRGITILMIEHVMQAVMSLAEHVFVLAEGRIISEGTPAKIVADPLVIEAYLGRVGSKLGRSMDVTRCSLSATPW